MPVLWNVWWQRIGTQLSKMFSTLWILVAVELMMVMKFPNSKMVKQKTQTMVNLEMTKEFQCRSPHFRCFQNIDLLYNNKWFSPIPILRVWYR